MQPCNGDGHFLFCRGDEGMLDNDEDDVRSKEDAGKVEDDYVGQGGADESSEEG
jgi:hypothetical protein